MKRKITLRGKAFKTNTTKNAIVYAMHYDSSKYQMPIATRNKLSKKEEDETDNLIQKINETANILLKRKYLEE